MLNTQLRCVQFYIIHQQSKFNGYIGNALSVGLSLLPPVPIPCLLFVWILIKRGTIVNYVSYTSYNRFVNISTVKVTQSNHRQFCQLEG